MKIKRLIAALVILISAMMLTSCLLPGMIPLNSPTAGPMPTMETNGDKVIETLQAGNYVRLEALAQEKYTEQDFAKPGTLPFTIKITDNKPTYFSYSWCAADEKTLQQNFEHIQATLYFNDEKLGKDVVHNLSYKLQNGMVCGDVGALMSDWPAGKYELKAVATFDQKINDGVSDYEPGDYIFVYNVTVNK
jgi:hypothetical protein